MLTRIRLPSWFIFIEFVLIYMLLIVFSIDLIPLTQNFAKRLASTGNYFKTII